MLLRDRGYEVINPLTDIDADEGSINVVGKDLQALRDTDVFLARWSLVPSAGTPMEIAYCDRWNIPVVIVADCAFDDISPWVQYHAKDIVDTIGDGVECVELFEPTKIV
jgi:hypothetical protein